MWAGVLVRTSAESSLWVSPGPQVAVQAFDVVAGLAGATVLVELLGTHLTAATLVCHPADPRWAGWGRGATGALGRTITLHLGSRVEGLVLGSVKWRLVHP